MQVVYIKLWLAELHNIVDSLKIALQPKRKWRRLVHYILNGIILRAKCCILFQISMTYDSKVQMTKCLRWFCLWFVFLTGDMLLIESTRMTTQLKNTCHQASVISQSSRMDFILRLPNCTDKHQMLMILTNPTSDIWILRLTKQTCWRDFGKTGYFILFPGWFLIWPPGKISFADDSYWLYHFQYMFVHISEIGLSIQLCSFSFLYNLGKRPVIAISYKNML